MDYLDNPQVQTMIDNMPEKTGKPLEDWLKIIKASKLEKHGEIIKLLKEEHGVTHGFANTITTIYRQQAEGGQTSDQELVDAQYEKKTHMRPWYDKLIMEINKFGDDVEIAPKKAYVSVRRAKQFAIIQPSTQKRMDLGLNLKDVDVSGVLIEGDKWSGMCSHRIEIHDEEDLNEEVFSWIEKAYESAI